MICLIDDAFTDSRCHLLKVVVHCLFPVKAIQQSQIVFLTLPNTTGDKVNERFVVTLVEIAKVVFHRHQAVDAHESFPGACHYRPVDSRNS